MNIEFAIAEDLPDIQDTFKRCFPQGYSLGNVKHHLEFYCIYKYVCRENDKINNIAYAIVWKNIKDSVIEIKWFFVNPEFARKWHGTCFLKKLGDMLVKRSGNKTIRISSTPESKGFYEKFGLTGTGLGTGIFLYWPPEEKDDENEKISYDTDEIDYENTYEKYINKGENYE